MSHETGLIANIAIAFMLAFAAGFAAKSIGLPPIVGYLIAGIGMGPFTPGFVGDAHLAAELAEIGIILLMFGVGIHFSLRDLLAVRSIAIPGAVGQITAATALGAGLAVSWGWSLGAGLVLGVAISVASTVVLIRALMDRDALDSIHGQVAVGWLIVEDLFTVLALVVLPALAVGLGADGADQAAGAEASNLAIALLTTLVKVGGFAALMLFVGARAVPWLLMQVARTGSKELFTLGVLATALGIAFGSWVLFGVSLALGAFFAGVVVGESDLSHQAATDALPLRDAFAVLFFVSVGMLFDPAFVISNLGPVLTLLLVVIVAKPASALLIVFALGYPVRTGLTVAAGLAQVGEFSFILAALGRQLELLPPEGYSLTIAVAIISITINPLLFHVIGPIEDWLRRNPRLLAVVERRTGELTKLPANTSEEALRGHAVICGYGRVGSVIGQALDRRGFRYAVIEQNRHIVEELRGRGIPSVWGNASDTALLNHLHLDSARMLLIAVPDPPAARHIVEHAHSVAPRLDIVVRTHSELERDHLQGQVRAALLGERELAIEMAGFALQRFGVSGTETMAIMQGLRGRNESSRGQWVNER